MSSWPIKCLDSECGYVTGPDNIAELMNPENRYLDAQGWFVCENCGSRGYIEKKYNTQEGGEFTPYLKAAIRPDGYEGETYQPFAFLASDSPDEHPEAVWFVYYKDTREQGGRLKMGYGPGGPPYLYAEDVLNLMVQMVRAGCLKADEVIAAVRKA